MNKLDEQLGDILVKVDKNTDINEVIRQVRKAFEDVGYISPSVMDLHMTGEQWYNRLKQELVSPTNAGIYYVGDLLMIARRASGMEQHPNV